MLALRICLLVLIFASFSHADFEFGTPDVHPGLLEDPPVFADVPATEPAKVAFGETPGLSTSPAPTSLIRFSEDYFTTGSARFDYYVFKIGLHLRQRISGRSARQRRHAEQHWRPAAFARIDRFTLILTAAAHALVEQARSRIWHHLQLHRPRRRRGHVSAVDVHLMAGARYFHQSNGDVHGGSTIQLRRCRNLCQPDLHV
jgi:hypothetical protein